jgi:hypothetical protein
MPFNSRFDGIWQYIIRPTFEERGLQCLRADDIFKPGSILDDILRSIKESDLIIADLTEQNANVYYELGYAHGLGKVVALITRDLSTLPFDLKQQRVVVYEDTSSGAARLKIALNKVLDSLMM